MSKNVDVDNNVLFDRAKVLRLNKYRCAVCRGINRKEGYYNESEQFIECDNHMKEWAIRNGLKLIRISLQVIEAPPIPKYKTKLKYLTLCRKHFIGLKNELRAYVSEKNKNAD